MARDETTAETTSIPLVEGPLFKGIFFGKGAVDQKSSFPPYRIYFLGQSTQVAVLDGFFLSQDDYSYPHFFFFFK